MMERPLLVHSIIEHAAAQYGDVEVVSLETNGPLFRYTYAQCAAGAHKMAQFTTINNALSYSSSESCEASRFIRGPIL